MPRLDIGELITDPDFAQDYIVHRKSGGTWDAGVWKQSETTITMTGAVIVAGTKDINQVPEGDRTSQIMDFYSNVEIFVTSKAGTSDEIEWRGHRYRIYQVKQYADYGYFKAIGVSMEGV